MQSRLRAWVPFLVSLAVLAVAIGVPSCSDDEKKTTETICDNGQDDDGDGLTDCADSDCAANAKCKGRTDGGLKDVGLEPDLGLVPDKGVARDSGEAALQQDVIDKVKLPTSASEFARDIDGSGPKNQLGAILAAFKALGFDLQVEMDFQIKEGNVLILLELFADALTDSKQATVKGHLGFDLDDNPANNFSGSEPFGISSNSPKDTLLAGSITGGKIKAGPGKMVLPLPMASKTPLMLNIQKAVLEGTWSSGGLADGVVSGGLLASEMESQVLPSLATLLNDLLGMTQVPEETKTIIKNLIDGADGTAKDGKITAAEIKATPALGTALTTPDVDTDGDGKKDALSMGVGISAVTCKIQR